MNRRELIKTGLIGLGAGALLSGCKNKEISLSSDEFNIVPKKTGTYEFSAPLPFNYKTIDEILELNSTLKKSKVTSFYNNAPNQDFNCWVSIDRARAGFEKHPVNSYDKFAKYVKYATDNGFNFTYLLNSPKPFSEKDYNTFKDEFYYLLDFLYKIGCRDIKVANTQVATLINDKFQNTFNLHASTAFEYHNISQYKYLFNNYPNFTLIDVSNDENQNFKLLASLRKQFPKVKLELMVNEGCIKGCPARISHISEGAFAVFNCPKMQQDLGPVHYFLKTGAIYPWNLEYYSALGINNFKYIASADMENLRSNYHDISSLKMYLDMAEGNLDKYSASEFFTKLYEKMVYSPHAQSEASKNMKISELKNYLPDIRHFVKHGHECSIKCGVECNYCYQCAKKLEKLLLYS